MAIPLCLTLLVSSWTDWHRRKIYNKVLLPAFLIALLGRGVMQGWPGVLQGLEGAGVGLALLFLFYQLGGIGAGDVKLLAVIGAYGGVTFVLSVFAWAALTGGLVSLLFLLRKRALVPALRHWYRLREPLHKDWTLPYGVILSLGVVAAYARPF